MPVEAEHPALTPGTVRWKVLSALNSGQSQWTAPQVAVQTGLALETVIRALGWLRDRQLVELHVWVGMDSLHQLSDAGREQLRRGTQLSLDLA